MPLVLLSRTCSFVERCRPDLRFVLTQVVCLTCMDRHCRPLPVVSPTRWLLGMSQIIPFCLSNTTKDVIGMWHWCFSHVFLPASTCNPSQLAMSPIASSTTLGSATYVRAPPSRVRRHRPYAGADLVFHPASCKPCIAGDIKLRQQHLTSMECAKDSSAPDLPGFLGMTYMAIRSDIQIRGRE